MTADSGRRRGLLLDGGAVLAISIVTVLLSQRWTALLLDSMFYATESLYGHEVTDRAVIPSYYSTRLGYIVPVRAYTSVLGTWPGFEAWRITLIIATTAGLFVICRRFTRRINAVLVTFPCVLSTVVLSYLANTYITGTVMALTAIVIAAALFDGWRAHLLVGVALGWLTMTHPVGLLLAGSVWAAIRIHEGIQWRRSLAAAGVALLTFLVFLGLGRVIFPDIGWFETYVKWNAQMNYSDFASKDLVWLRDISLLVPVLILVLVVVAWLLHRGEKWAQLALITILTSLGFMLTFSPLMGGVALEAPMYQAMLWPPALAALAMVGAGLLGELRLPVSGLVVSVLVIVAVVAAGHWTGTMSLTSGLLLALFVAVVFSAALFALRTRRTAATAVVLVVLIGLVGMSAQFLQNARRTLGLYPHTPYANAFVPNTVSAKMHEAVNAQQWLLEHTTSDDQILNWVGGDWVGGDRELYMVAGMQLWGENRITLEPRVTPIDTTRLADLRPTVVQMVGPTMDSVITFWSSLPAQTHPTPPTCYDFPWPGPDITTGHQCLSRLTWPAP
jgi:hypothetical protein